MNLKLLYPIIISTLILRCYNKNNFENNESSEKEKIIKFSDARKAKLVDSWKRIHDCDLDYKNLYNTIKNNNPYDNYLKIENYKWIYFKTYDSTFFERADQLKTLCKIYENKRIVSIAFTDIYTYKDAIHVINFKKPEYTPISSFLLYSLGGDAEDFWEITPEKISSTKFRLTDIDAYYNDIETMDTTFYNYKIVSQIEIDTISGNIKKKRISEERNFFKVEK